MDDSKPKGLTVRVDPDYEERLRDEAAMRCLAELVGRDNFSMDYCVTISEQVALAFIEARRRRKEATR